MISSTTKKGLLAETKFELECYNRDILVSKPTNTSSPYDLIIDINNKLLKIQIKYVGTKDEEGYFVQMRKGSSCKLKNGTFKVNRYTTEEIDYVAAYIAELDSWYIIPIKDIPRNKLRIAKKYQIFKDNWNFG